MVICVWSFHHLESAVWRKCNVQKRESQYLLSGSTFDVYQEWLLSAQTHLSSRGKWCHLSLTSGTQLDQFLPEVHLTFLCPPCWSCWFICRHSILEKQQFNLNQEQSAKQKPLYRIRVKPCSVCTLDHMYGAGKLCCGSSFNILAFNGWSEKIL